MNFDNEYTYMAMELLSDDLNDLSNYTNIFLGIYSVNTYCKIPFVQYLLINNGSDILSMPILTSYSKLKKNDVVSYSKVYLSGLLNDDNYDNINNSIKVKGFYEYRGNLYIFYDITKYNIKLDEIQSSNRLKLAIFDEILNRKSVCNIKIDQKITNFFINNDAFIFLYDKNNRPYEIPIVGYIGKSTKQQLNFTYTFGETAKNKSAIMGPYYYFTDYFNSIQQLCKSNLNGGIVRFALFMGKIKYIENMPNDNIDNSEIKKHMLNDNTINNMYEKMTLKISDHDGLWALNYNSIYLSKLELDDGSFIKDAPIIVVKEYSQQVPLSYHYVDRNIINDNNDFIRNDRI